jgi:hypothetical protein
MLAFTIASMPARAQSFISTFDQVNQFFVEDPSRTLEDLLPKLDPKIRSNYSLAYSSNSEVGSSLMKPRVILSSTDANFILAYAGDPSAKGGQQLEMIQVNPKTKQPEFKVVDFANKQAVVDHHPAACAACHAEGLGTKNLRHIWETYPDWPGFYGTAHNNANFGGTGVGTSSLPHFEFEEKNFKAFLATEAKSDRFKHLIGLEKQTLNKLAEFNSDFTDRIGRVNGMRFLERMAESPEFPKHATRLELYLHGVSNYNEGLNFQGNVKRIRTQLEKHYQEKAKRVYQLVQRYGSVTDKTSVGEKLLTTTDQNLHAVSRTYGVAAFDLKPGSAEKTAWFVDYVEQNLKITAGDIASSRFSGQYAMATGETGIYGGTGVKTQIGRSYDDFFKSKSILAKPTVFDGEGQVLKKHWSKAQSPEALETIFQADDFFMKHSHPDRVKRFREETRRSVTRMLDVAESAQALQKFGGLKSVDKSLKADLETLASDLGTWKQKPKTFGELSDAITSKYLRLKSTDLADELIVSRAKEILASKAATSAEWLAFLKTKGVTQNEFNRIRAFARDLMPDLPALGSEKLSTLDCFVNALRRLVL